MGQQAKYVIRSIDDLLLRVKDLTGENNSRLWFRGQANSSWTLTPSIQRKDVRYPESYITNDFYIRTKQVLPNPPEKEKFATWMSMM